MQTVIETLVHPTAERIVAAALARGDVNLSIELTQAVTPADFATPLFGVICEAVTRVVMGVEPLDHEAICAEARDIVRERKLKVNVTKEFLQGLESEDIARAKPYANTVKRYAWLRQAPSGFAAKSPPREGRAGSGFGASPLHPQGRYAAAASLAEPLQAGEPAPTSYWIVTT